MRALLIRIRQITAEAHYLGILKYFSKLHFKGACYENIPKDNQ